MNEGLFLEKTGKTSDNMDKEAGRIKQENKKRFELLAPAGSPDILRAVLAAGADAVYVGGKMFGARAYAGNFSNEELLEAIDYVHLRGRKLYLTVNTLLKNMQIGPPLYDYLLPLYERGLDAVIVQDFGAFDYIHRAFPDLPIHTSTQMTVTGVDGVRLLAQLGAKRVVMSREVSLDETRRIHEQTGVELEAFVHGALCYSYSGQCLFSSMLGGRSGNRGRCAQPCRLPYTLLGDNKTDDAYILSMKDLCGIEDLNRLADSGVYSLKIEGRMKQIPYAAGVVSFYRKYIDCGMPVDRRDMKEIRELGSRCGFTRGYFNNPYDENMVTFVKPGYERQNEELQNRMITLYANRQERLEAAGKLTLQKGEPAVYEVSCRDVTIEVTGMEVMEAKSKPLFESDVRERMDRTGESPFAMKELTIAMGDAVFLPNGELNRLRREALLALKEKLLKDYLRSTDSCTMSLPVPIVQKPDTKNRVICLTQRRELLLLLTAHEYVTTIYLDAGAYESAEMIAELQTDIALCRAAQKEIYFALPRIFREGTADRYRKVAGQLRELAFDGFLVRSYEELLFVKENFPQSEMVLDHNMYTYNDYAAAAFMQCGAAKNTVPYELNRGEIAHRDNRYSEMVVYGYYPLMTSAQCIRKNTMQCDKRPQVCYLQDRYKVRFPVKNYCSDCYNVIYNSLPVMLFSKLEELKKAGIRNFRMDFTMETEEQARRILKLYQEFALQSRNAYPEEYQDRYTNGHYNRGVE